MGKTVCHVSKKSRVELGKNPDPNYSLIDSRSVKTTSSAQERGYDGGKKIKGRKHHIVTDTEGHLLHVKAHAANIHDGIAGGEVIEEVMKKYPSLKGVCGDAGYRRTFEETGTKLGLIVDIVERIKDAGWMVLPKKWRVERTFSWMNIFRRLSKDYEILTSSVENMIIIAHIAILLNRL